MARARLLAGLLVAASLSGCLTHDVGLYAWNYLDDAVWVEFWVNATDGGEALAHENVSLEGYAAGANGSGHGWSGSAPLKGNVTVEARATGGLYAAKAVEVPGRSLLGAVTGWGGYGLTLTVAVPEGGDGPGLRVHLQHAD